MILNGQIEEYAPPSWAATIASRAPTHRIRIANLPTPVHDLHLPGLPEGCRVVVKRDDMTGTEFGGNKVRKLEFIVCDAIRSGRKDVVTIGGTQSNHCRATAAVCARLGLRPHLLLREDSSPMGGNVLLDRLMGARITHVSRERWLQDGPTTLLDAHCATLAAGGGTPYGIPVGGSNAMGTWGYLNMVQEVEQVVDQLNVTDIALCTGSGATLLGTGLGVKLWRPSNGPKVHGYTACDTPQWFYDTMDGILAAGAFNVPYTSKDMVTVRDAKGGGYARSSTEELQFLCRVARESGVVFDSTYTNKSVMKLVADLKSGELSPKGTLMFVHTGGIFSVFDKEKELDALMKADGL